MERIDVLDLLAAPGATRDVRLMEVVDDLGTEVARVPGPVGATLRIESVVEGLVVRGRLEGVTEYRCARCLRPSSRPFRVEVEELFVRTPREEDDEYPIEDDGVDPEPMVRDAVVLALPFSPLCRPECLGLCERCGGDRNLGECSCGPRVDPRWAPLASLELE